jgi:hypothetical protein
MCLLLLLVPATGCCHIVDGVGEEMRKQKVEKVLLKVRVWWWVRDDRQV